MGKRLIMKGIKMTLRERKLFMIFTGIYTILIFLTSFFIELMYNGSGTFTNAGFFVVIFILASLILSLLYAWIVVSRNKRIWATLKCIGYTSGNVNAMVTGIIMFTTLTGFIIVIEILFHYSAIIGYLGQAGLLLTLPRVLISLFPVILTSGIFLLVQILAVIIANGKISKVRPMIALKKPGE